MQIFNQIQIVKLLDLMLGFWGKYSSHYCSCITQYHHLLNHQKLSISYRIQVSSTQNCLTKGRWLRVQLCT